MLPYICTVCRARYEDEGSHVATDLHLEAMAVQTVADWAARSPHDKVAIGIAKQIARLEHHYDSYDDWRHAMGLPDTDETLTIQRRISAIWIRALGHLPDYDRQMRYARELLKIEQEGV